MIQKQLKAPIGLNMMSDEINLEIVIAYDNT